MKELSKLMGYRESVQVLDATLRDGGLVNDFRFTDEFVRELYKTDLRCGIDYMEVGYKADKEIFDVDSFGKWKFCDDDDILAVIGEPDPALKLGVMADVGRCNYKQDIQEKANSPVTLIRVATYLNTMPAALDMIEDAKNKGYEVSCNIMAISNGQEADVRIALDMLAKSPVDYIYIVDSFGSLYPEQIQRLANLYLEYASASGKTLGIHAHNNQQLAFANTIEAVGDGVDLLDGTYCGMGRGAGNCYIESLLGFLRNPKYSLYPALQFIEKQMLPLQESGVEWGVNVAYLLTGILNQHPRSAIAFSKARRKDICGFYRELTGLD